MLEVALMALRGPCQVMRSARHAASRGGMLGRSPETAWGTRLKALFRRKAIRLVRERVDDVESRHRRGEAPAISSFGLVTVEQW